MSRIPWVLSLSFLVLSALGVQSAAAQSYLAPETPRKGIWMEAMHPNMKDPFKVTAPSSAWFFSGRYPLTHQLSGVLDVPVAYGRLDGEGASEWGRETVLGNPYLGVELAATDRVQVELGVRPPLNTVNEESFGDVVGFLADPFRGEAFMDDVVPVSGAVTFKQAIPSGMGADVRARAGVTTAIYTGDEDDLNQTTTFLDYGMFATLPVGITRLGAGVSGRWDATEDEGKFSDNSIHQLGLSADVLFLDRFRPGISVHVPVDKPYRDSVGSTIGLYLQVALP